MGKILVIGSSNTDLIANVESFPLAGETIQGKFFLQAMGGKGANQALAAHKLGGDVGFITCLGNDANGQNTLSHYKQQGVDVSKALVTNDAPTGTAIILVNDEGENCIVITAGANHKLSVDYILKIEKEIKEASMVMLQMEIPFTTVEKVCELASKYNKPILLNVAPAREIGMDMLRMASILIVNETEIEKISNQKIETIGENAVVDILLSRGANTVILTMGAKGCIVRSKNINQLIPAFKVNVVDTTAAGDTFCGALAAQLSKGKELIAAARFATAASAICVTRMGAQPSIPDEAEVNEFISDNIK